VMNDVRIRRACFRSMRRTWRLLSGSIPGVWVFVYVYVSVCFCVCVCVCVCVRVCGVRVASVLVPYV
jgi:hypothetical protein